ncbi:MAG: hypothetical protein K1X82_12740 [Bacteroidia bacterium]|nr:hypothetical protein [Bacteroidia bacterium]
MKIKLPLVLALFLGTSLFSSGQSTPSAKSSGTDSIGVADTVRIAKTVLPDSLKKVSPNVVATEPIATNKEPKVKGDSKLNFGMAVHLQVGTIGPGGAIGIRFLDQLSCRVGFNYFKLNTSFEGNFFDVNLKHSPDLTLGAISLMVDYFPVTKSSFHITGGVAYNLNHYKYGMVYNDTLQYGTIVVNGENAGTLHFDVKSSKIVPYLGIGFGRAVPKKRVGFGFELGCFYHGKPQVSIDATKLIEQTKDEQQQLQDNLSGYRFFPYLNLHLSVKLTK